MKGQEERYRGLITVGLTLEQAVCLERLMLSLSNASEDFDFVVFGGIQTAVTGALNRERGRHA